MSIDGVERLGTSVEYAGAYYDSWTEGVWAAYFDAAGMPFIHEPETFVLPERMLGGARIKISQQIYTPDFYLPEQNVFVEVKNGNVDDGTQFKLRHLARLTGIPGLLLDGKPENASVYLMGTVQQGKTFGKHRDIVAEAEFSLYKTLAWPGHCHPAIKPELIRIARAAHEAPVHKSQNTAAYVAAKTRKKSLFVHRTFLEE